MTFIYSNKYYADIGLHVFPILKYRLLYEKLIQETGTLEKRFIEPLPAGREDLLLVHTAEYLKDLDQCVWTERTSFSEMPLSRSIIELFVLACGGTSEACRRALHDCCAIHLSGGFHHAFADRAEGFCYLNDLAVAARVIQQNDGVDRIMIVDCDLHQGNGTAVIFQDDVSVYTFSIHQHDLYPEKERSNLDIHLPMGVKDDAYLGHLQDNLPQIFETFHPDLVLYQAGADPYYDDQLGHLSLSIEGLRKRDTFIFELCKSCHVPVAVTLGGGYACQTEDTVQIHFNTCMAAVDVFEL